MKNLGRRLMSVFLTLILSFSLCVSVFAAQDQGEDFGAESISGANITELFSLLGNTDGSGSEDLAYKLYQAFDTNPREFISAAAELQNDDLTTMVDLLVYFAGYFDLDDFEEQVISCEDDLMTESEQRVVEEILRAIDLRQNQIVVIEPEEELPEVPEYNPYFLEKLISSHVSSNNFEDEEFFETLSDVFIEDPTTFSAVIENISVAAQEAIVGGVAEACVNSGKVFSRVNAGNLTEEQETIISAVQEKIVAINSTASENVVLGGQEIAVPMSTQVPTIGTMTYAGELICGEATTLTVNFSETTATSSVRTYWTEVYAVRNGKEYLKSSKSITIAKGATSTKQTYSITYSDTGVVYTLVKVYSTNGGTLLTQRQGTYSDTVTGPWSIIVTLPQNRNYKGSLSLYHANGALQKTCECLGLAESNGSMSVENGNTPTGTYRGELYAASSNTYSYGPYRRVTYLVQRLLKS